MSHDLTTLSRRRFLELAGMAAVSLAAGPILAAETSEIVDISWSRGPLLPRPIKGQAQGTLGNKILYSGGFAFDTTGYQRPPATASRTEVNKARSPRTIRYCRETRLFDPETQKFERLPDAPVGAFWPEGIAAGDAFYLLTGAMRQPVGATVPRDWQKGEKRDLTSPRVFRLRHEAGAWKWTELPSLRFGRHLPGVAVVGTTLYVMGGRSLFGGTAYSGDRAGPHINAVESLDLSRPEEGWKDVAPLPGMARENPAVSVAGGKLYMFGGFYDRIYQRPDLHSRFCGDAFCYDPATKRWDQLPDMPFGLEGSPAVTVDDRTILIFAGLHGGNKVEHPFTGDRSGPPRANYHTIAYDVRDQKYRLLPTPLPPPPDDPAKQITPASDPNSTAHNYWCLPRASVIGDTVYLFGAEVLDLAYSNCSDVTWIGKLKRRLKG